MKTLKYLILLALIGACATIATTANASAACSGSLVSGIYPASGWRWFIADNWYGVGCWDNGHVVSVNYQIPVL